MKNKIWIIGLILTIIVVIIVGVVLFNNKTNEEEFNGKIVKFEYNYGNYFGGYRYYNIYTENNEIYITAKGQNGIDLNIEKKFDKSGLNQLELLVKRHKIYEWNGFNKKDDNVSDGNSFSLTIEYDDGKTIKAEGYHKYPANYDVGHKALSNYLENIK